MVSDYFIHQDEKGTATRCWVLVIMQEQQELVTSREELLMQLLKCDKELVQHFRSRQKWEQCR